MMMNNGGKRIKVMNKLQESVLFRIAALNNPSSSAANSSVLHRRLVKLFNSFRTPSHPPYALMIKRAVTELNEENGSTEEAISDFIKREYDDLPWAHVSILDLHLRKLCLDGDIVRTETGRYVLLIDDAIGNVEETKCKRSEKRRKETGEGIERDHGMQNEQQTLVSEFHSAGANNPWRLVKVPDRTEQHGKSEMQLPRMAQIEHQQNQSDCQGSGATNKPALRIRLRLNKNEGPDKEK